MTVNQEGEYKTIHHGVGGTKTLPEGEWVKAEKKMVVDGSKQKRYLSGFHCFGDKETAYKYREKFKLENRLVAVVRIEVRGEVRRKESNPSVYLVDEIRIP